MPFLNVLCTCERIIIDASGTPSLISLFQRMDLQLAEVSFPEDMVAPAKWVIFCMWQLTADEVGREFVQHTKIIRPNGVVVQEAIQPFQSPSDVDLQIRTFIEMSGMHVGQEGHFRIQVWLAGHEDNLYETKFFIKHVSLP
jgi:hypothetical protein